MVVSAINNSTGSRPLSQLTGVSNRPADTAAVNHKARDLHHAHEHRNVIRFDHLNSYFKLDGQVVGNTQIFDKSQGKKVDVEIRRVTEGDLETYKLVVNNEVIAFASIKIIGDDKDTNVRTKVANKIWQHSPLNGFAGQKEKQAKIIAEFSVNREPHKYSGVNEITMQVIHDRMQELEKSKGIKFQGLQIVTSYNSGSVCYKMGLKLGDHDSPDAWSARKCDKYIAEQIKAAGDANQANTEALGCTTMFLPKSQIKSWAKKIKKDPIMDKTGSNFHNGKVTLTKKDGSKVEAELTREKDSHTGLEVFKIKANGQELGSIQVNYMKMKGGKVHDYCGDYDKSSPFSQYGNGWFFGWFGTKKAQSKVFVEIEDMLSNDFVDLQEKLYQIPIEIAAKNQEFAGRVQVEADWNDHAKSYKLGFRTQKYRGLKSAKDLEAAYKKEIRLAKDQGRVPNVKQFGSQLMTLSREQIEQSFGKASKVLNA